MSKKKADQNLIEIPLPEDIFDVPGASVSRSKRVSFQKVVEIRKKSRTTGVPWQELAEIYPEWHGVIDATTGEPLPNPSEDPMIFAQLDYADQVPWFVYAGLAYSPNQARKAPSA